MARVVLRIYPALTVANAHRVLRDLQRASPMQKTRVPTEKGIGFGDRLFGLRNRRLTRLHEFDLL